MTLRGWTSRPALTSNGSNALVSLDLDGVRGLVWMDCSGNDLPRLDLHSTASLLTLDCRGNALTTLDVASCDANLKADVRSNPGLTTVYCLVSQNISFDGPTELTRL